ncbi:MAG: hypothetical protein WBD36_09080 [Bacteroidota bacterium]
MKLHEIVKIVMVVAVLAALWGCKKDNNPVANNTPSYIIPLAVGNQWDYVDSLFNSTGGFLRVDSSSLRIVGKTTVQYQSQSQDVYYWNWLNNLTKQPSASSWLTANESDGNYGIGGISSKGTFVLARTLWAKYPSNVGDSWQRANISLNGDSTFSISDTSTVTVLAVNEVFPTRTGNLTCYVYNYQREGTVSTSVYYSIDIGYVGVIVRSNGYVTFKKTLRSFKLN